MSRFGDPDATPSIPSAASHAEQSQPHSGVPAAIADEIARSRAHLDAGEISLARAAYLRGRALSMRGSLRQAEVSDLVALCALDGEICEREGRPEAAVEAYRIAHSLAPHDTEHVLDAIEVMIEHDPEVAVAMCRQARAAVEGDDDRLHLVLLEAEARIDLGLAAGPDEGAGEVDEATAREVRALLDQLDHFIIDDPDTWAHVGDMYRAIGARDLAAHVYRTAVSLEPDCAEAYHGLGHLYELAGERALALDAWLQVRAIDLANPPASHGLDEDDWLRIARRTVAELPPALRDRLADVNIQIDAVPAEALILDGVDPRLFGWFSGPTEAERAATGPGAAGPGVIHLFANVLERAHRDRHELAAAIRATLCREAAYYLGLDEDELAATRLD